MLVDYFGDERPESGCLGGKEDAKDGGDVPPAQALTIDKCSKKVTYKFLVGTTAGTTNMMRREKWPRQETMASCRPSQFVNHGTITKTARVCCWGWVNIFVDWEIYLCQAIYI